MGGTLRIEDVESGPVSQSVSQSVVVFGKPRRFCDVMGEK